MCVRLLLRYLLSIMEKALYISVPFDWVTELSGGIHLLSGISLLSFLLTLIYPLLFNSWLCSDPQYQNSKSRKCDIELCEVRRYKT